MKLVMMKRHHLDSRCKRYGVSYEDVEPCIQSVSGDTIVVDASHPSWPTGASTPPIPGVGAHLKALIALFMLGPKTGCGCSEYAAKMDSWGPDGCEARLPEIVEHLRDQAKRKSLPFSEFVARKLVELAIRRARRDASKPKGA